MPPIPLKITLLSPSLPLEISSFPLNPLLPYPTILAKIRLALGNIPQAYPYTTKRAPIEDFSDVKARNTVLVGTDYFEVPLAERKRGVVGVQGGEAVRAWMGLTPGQRRMDIQSRLSNTKTSIPVPIYFTLPLSLARTRLDDLTTCTSPPSASSSLAVIGANWTLPLDALLGFQGMASPYGIMEEWDARLLAALALLSECLVAQEMVASTCVLDGVGVRAKREGGGGVVKWGDVVDCLEGLMVRVE